MGAPLIVPSRVWSTDQAKAFVDTALEVLGTDAGLPEWPERRDQIISEIMFADGLSREDAERYVPPPPSTAVRRAAWLDDHQIEQPLMEALLAAGSLYGLMRVVLAEAEQTDLSPEPNRLAMRILTLILDRLDLFHMFLHWIKRHPRFLADMLLFPPSAALACMLIARWDPPQDAWNRALTLRDHEAAKASALAEKKLTLYRMPLSQSFWSPSMNVRQRPPREQASSGKRSLSLLSTSTRMWVMFAVAVAAIVLPAQRQATKPFAASIGTGWPAAVATAEAPPPPFFWSSGLDNRPKRR
jgi:hypothetical protein